MQKRITFMISEKNLTKARKIQAKMIPENDWNVSLSYVLNMLIEEGSKKY